MFNVRLSSGVDKSIESCFSIALALCGGGLTFAVLSLWYRLRVFIVADRSRYVRLVKSQVIMLRLILVGRLNSCFCQSLCLQ